MARPLVSDERWEWVEPLIPRVPRRHRFPGCKRIDDLKVLTRTCSCRGGDPVGESAAGDGCGSGATGWRRLRERRAGVWRRRTRLPDLPGVSCDELMLPESRAGLELRALLAAGTTAVDAGIGRARRPGVAAVEPRRWPELAVLSGEVQGVLCGVVEAHRPAFRRGSLPGFRVAGGVRSFDVALVVAGVGERGFGCEERVVELCRRGKPSCPHRVSTGRGDRRRGRRAPRPICCFMPSLARGAGSPARARPRPPSAARGRRPRPSPPCANEMCRLSPIAVASSAASANRAAARLVPPSRSAISARLQSDRAIRETSPIRRRSSRLSS